MKLNIPTYEQLRDCFPVEQRPLFYKNLKWFGKNLGTAETLTAQKFHRYAWQYIGDRLLMQENLFHRRVTLVGYHGDTGPDYNFNLTFRLTNPDLLLGFFWNEEKVDFGELHDEGTEGEQEIWVLHAPPKVGAPVLEGF